ncbi:hypothetical protein HGM15179_014361 [Zosterops borbonicus]|uniref:Uncharacterized protein n=1 Tax=Zosterops borbonicus TaxID=364589 RepID=A0A8K1G6X8_9PASS|nr:hypothetical protein HGM15179_014361 [Zosterops borbonicus]
MEQLREHLDLEHLDLQHHFGSRRGTNLHAKQQEREGRLDISSQGEVDEVVPLADVLAQDARGWMGATLRFTCAVLQAEQGGCCFIVTQHNFSFFVSLQVLLLPQVCQGIEGVGELALGQVAHSTLTFVLTLFQMQMELINGRVAPSREAKLGLCSQGEVDEAVPLADVLAQDARGRVDGCNIKVLLLP